MEPISSSEAQHVPLNYKSTASNTNSALCGCCGLKDYAQAFAQPHFFRALYPGFPNCKRTQDNSDEKFPVQPQFFPNFPFYPPFFSSTPIPLSSCCPRNPPSSTSTSEQSRSENNPTCLPTNQCCHSPKENNGSMIYNSTLNDDQSKNSLAQPEIQYLGNPFCFANSPDTKMNFLFHRCACGDSFPWACTPFFLPIISYSVSWNSQKSNLNTGCAFVESQLRQNNNETPPTQSNSNNFVDKEVSLTNQTEVKDYRSITTVTSQQDHLRDRARSLSPLAYNVPNTIQPNSSGSLGKIPESIDNLTNNSNNCVEDEDIEVDMEECTSIGQVKDGSSSCFSNDPSLKDNESQLPSSSQSFSDLKKCEAEDGGAVDVFSFEKELTPTEISLNEKNSNDEWEKNQIEMKKSNTSEIIPSKKCIKSFTMREKVKSELSENAQFTTSAGGDLGGENCVGYKVNIQSILEDQQYNTIQDLQDPQEPQINENNEWKELFTQIPSKSFTKNSRSEAQNNSKETTEKIPKKPGNSKSGIAKFSYSSKLKGGTEENMKSKSIEKEPTVMKRKHSCYPSDNTQSSKIQKTKNVKVAKYQQQESKNQKPTNQRNESLKKEEKSPKPKSQLSNNSEKVGKCVVKKTKISPPN